MALLGSASALASTPDTIQSVIEVCSPVISEEYSGDTDRWGHCVEATQDFVNFMGGSGGASDPDKVSADLAYELALLYQDDPEACVKYETELPKAIEVAAKFSVDEDQKKLIILMGETIAKCEGGNTGSIGFSRIPVSPT